MKKLSFRIRKCYFDAIVSGEKITEYRRYIRFWLIRLGGKSWADAGGLPLNSTWKCQGEFMAVFISGKRIHRREIRAISRFKTPDWFSDQGKKDVDTESCLVFHLGNEIQEVPA